MSQHDAPQHPEDRPPITRTEADTETDTRFGPRPVPEGHRRPSGPAESRRIPPHGDVSPDGGRVWPRPSTTAKWLVWGGTALGAAALTAGTVIAARHLLGLSDDDDRSAQPRSRVAPRFAELSPQEREAMRERARARESQDARRAARLRAEALHNAAPDARPRRRQPGLLQEVEANTASMSNGVDNVMRSLGAAMTGFRTVAAQAGAIMREFGDAADLVRGIMGRGGDQPGAAAPRCRGAPPAPPRQRRPDGRSHDPSQDRHGAHMPDLRDDPLLHDPMDGPDDAGPTDHNPRLHRL